MKWILENPRTLVVLGLGAFIVIWSVVTGETSSPVFGIGIGLATGGPMAGATAPKR